MSLDWTIVEVTLGPDSERPVYRSWVLGVGGNMRDKAWDICLSPWRSPRGKAYVDDNGKLGLGP